MAKHRSRGPGIEVALNGRLAELGAAVQVGHALALAAPSHLARLIALLGAVHLPVAVVPANSRGAP